MFLMLVFTGVVQLLSIMDAAVVDYVHLLNLLYIPVTMYQIVKMMDTKQAKLANSFFPLIASVLTIAAIYMHLTAHLVASQYT